MNLWSVQISASVCSVWIDSIESSSKQSNNSRLALHIDLARGSLKSKSMEIFQRKRY